MKNVCLSNQCFHIVSHPETIPLDWCDLVLTHFISILHQKLDKKWIKIESHHSKGIVSGLWKSIFPRKNGCLRNWAPKWDWLKSQRAETSNVVVNSNFYPTALPCSTPPLQRRGGLVVALAAQLARKITFPSVHLTPTPFSRLPPSCRGCRAKLFPPPVQGLRHQTTRAWDHETLRVPLALQWDCMSLVYLLMLAVFANQSSHITHSYTCDVQIASICFMIICKPTP